MSSTSTGPSTSSSSTETNGKIIPCACQNRGRPLKILASRQPAEKDRNDKKNMDTEEDEEGLMATFFMGIPSSIYCRITPN